MRKLIRAIAILIIVASLTSIVYAGGLDGYEHYDWYNMRPIWVEDTVDLDYFIVNDLENRQETTLKYTVPKDGAVVLVFYSHDCGNSKALLRSLNGTDFFKDDRIQIVAVNCDTNADESLYDDTVDFVDEYLYNYSGKIKNYYSYSSILFEYAGIITGDNSRLTFPVVVVITESSGKNMIAFGETALSQSSRVEKSLEFLLDIDSGDMTENEIHTKEELREAWKSVTQNKSSNLFTRDPVESGDYRIGELSDEAIENGLTMFNFIRYLCGLPEVQMNDTYSYLAAHGAVVLAANDELTHTPTKPLGMDDEFYSLGYEATTNSNLGSGIKENSLLLQQLVIGCIEDDGFNNFATVGHRRWMMNPYLEDIGFGAAVAEDGTTYSALYVTDKSGSGVDYEYLEWPVEGSHPQNLMTVETPWSISLNVNKYATADPNTLKITLTREIDGKSWVFDKSTGGPANSYYKPYLIVEPKNYGLKNTIIFFPGKDQIGEEYTGVYSVEVTGLKTLSGQDAEISYTVDFFDIESDSDCSHYYIELNETAPTCTEAGKVTWGCLDCGNTYSEELGEPLGHSYLEKYVEPTCTEYGGTLTWCSNCDYEDFQKLNEPVGHDYFLSDICRYCGRKDPNADETDEFDTDGVFLDINKTDYYFDSVRWAFENKVTSGTSDNTFSPNKVCTRAQVVTFLWRANGSPEPNTSNNPFVDVEDDKYYTKAIIWAVENGITSGIEEDKFGPDESVTRAQFVTFLYRSAGSPKVYGESRFIDITDNTYYSDAVIWAHQNGITSGTSDNEFSPNNFCTRAQVVTFLYRNFNK